MSKSDTETETETEYYIVQCYIDHALQQHTAHTTEQSASDQGEAFLDAYAHLTWNHDVHYYIHGVRNGQRYLLLKT